MARRRLAKLTEANAALRLADLQYKSGALGGRLPELAEAGLSVIALDRVFSVRGSYPWQYSSGDSQLREKATELEKHFLLLENEIAGN